jgi:hypothetical protein
MTATADDLRAVLVRAEGLPLRAALGVPDASTPARSA